MAHYDIAIILGGGPGGYVAAIRAAQRGATTVLIEEDKTRKCLQCGLHSTRRYSAVRRCTKTLSTRLTLAWL